jgi:hypothetical protein
VIDAWSGPTPTPQEYPKNEPNGIRKLLDKIKALELQIREATSNLLGTAGIRLSLAGMFIDSSLTVGGSLDVTGPTTIGGTVGVTGDATFSGDTTIGGNAAITGTLSLPAGIIDNDALAHPTIVGSAAAEFGMSAAIALSANPAAPTTLTTLSVVVPAGATNAIATTSVVPAIYTASGTGSFTATVESTLTSGGTGAFSYAGQIVDVVGAVTSACTVTKPIVLAVVTPGATITMRATAYASGAGVLAEGDGSLSILFLR